MNAKEQSKQIERLLGKKVTVQIDRPVGFTDGGLVYPLNCGHVQTSGGMLETYIVGLQKPLTSFSGRIIGGIVGQRAFKLVAAPDGVLLNQAQIAEAVAFAEGDIPGKVEAMLQKSCGAILYRNGAEEREFLLLLQRRSETWSFPKGHVEAGETEKQTAIREIREETGLSVELISDFRYKIHYSITKKINKHVVLFLAEASGEPIFPSREIAGYRWIPESRIREEISPVYRKMMGLAIARLNRRDKSGEADSES